MACVGVGDFVGHHACQLALVFRQGDEAPENVDVSPGRGKGVDRRAVDHVEGEIEGNPLLLGQDLRTDLADVVDDLLVLGEGIGLLELFVDLAAELLLFLDREARSAGREG